MTRKQEAVQDAVDKAIQREREIVTVVEDKRNMLADIPVFGDVEHAHRYRQRFVQEHQGLSVKKDKKKMAEEFREDVKGIWPYRGFLITKDDFFHHLVCVNPDDGTETPPRLKGTFSGVFQAQRTIDAYFDELGGKAPKAS